MSPASRSVGHLFLLLTSFTLFSIDQDATFVMDSLTEQMSRSTLSSSGAGTSGRAGPLGRVGIGPTAKSTPSKSNKAKKGTSPTDAFASTLN